MKFPFASLFDVELMRFLNHYLTKLYAGEKPTFNCFWDELQYQENRAWKNSDLVTYNLLQNLADWVNGKIYIELSKNSKVAASVARIQGEKITKAELIFQKQTVDKTVN